MPAESRATASTEAERRAVISLDHVTKRFGPYVAVQDADFEIGEGEFFALLGPSGCGKTTTLRMIAGFEEPTEGHILLDGQDVSHVPPYRRDVNTVFQHYALFPHMSVFENVAFGLRTKKVADEEVRRRVLEMLDIVRLPEFAERSPAQLSGGQQQRIALARALVNLPKALLLDEPLGALDLKLRQMMQLELKRIQREVGITFVFVTHDQEEALTMSDRIAVMNQGLTDQIGTPVDIYHRPSSVFVAGFIGTANLLPVEVGSQNGDTVTVESRTGGQFRVPAMGRAYAAGNRVTFMIRPERLRVSTGAPTEPVGGTIAAKVSSLVFQGPVIRCQVTTQLGADVVAHITAEDTLPMLHIDDPVSLSWAADAGYLVPEEISADQAGVTRIEEDQTAPAA